MSAAPTYTRIQENSRDVQQRSVIGEERRVCMLIELVIDHPDTVSSCLQSQPHVTRLATWTVLVAKTSNGFSNSVTYSEFNKQLWEVDV